MRPISSAASSFGPRWRGDYGRLPDYGQVHCPAAEQISDRGVWLHHRVLLGSEQDVVELVDAIKKVQAHA